MKLATDSLISLNLFFTEYFYFSFSLGFGSFQTFRFPQTLNLAINSCNSSDIFAKSIADEAISSMEASCSSVVADTL